MNRWTRLGAAVGVASDDILGEAGLDPHPVAIFGWYMERIERVLYRPSRAAGAAHAAVGVTSAALAGRGLGSTIAGTYVSVAGRGLREVAATVADSIEANQLADARSLLPALVGRNPAALDEAGIARAVVESVAENTVDALVAPAFWAAVAGPAGVLGYRAINTLDSMVGHHSERYEEFGWASARLDDLANFLPARLTAALVIAARPSSLNAVARAVTSQAPAHPSPNAGVAEAAFAAALGCTLGGRLEYGERVEDRPLLGTGPAPTPEHVREAIRLSRDVGRLMVAGLIGSAILLP